MALSKRFVAITIALILSVVTYCAQTCFDMDTKPVCPKHHTADCCKHETPVSSGTLQALTSFVSGTAKFLPSAPEIVTHLISVIPERTDLVHSRFSMHTDLCTKAFSTTILRI
jgi:hypothetical protein